MYQKKIVVKMICVGHQSIEICIFFLSSAYFE